MKDILTVKGFVGEKINKLIDNFILPCWDANPFLTEQFAFRDDDITRKLMPWQGEFPGKFLTSLAYMYLLTYRKDLKELGDSLCHRLAELNDDGYMGPFSKEKRFVGLFDEGNHDHFWDGWGHGHIIYGLEKWNEATGNKEAQRLSRKICDYLYDFFIKNGVSYDECGWHCMNQGLTLAISLVVKKYGREKDKEFLVMLSEYQKGEWAGDVLNDTLKGIPLYKTKQPRWEILVSAEAWAELYEATEDRKYKNALCYMFDGIMKYDIHNTGGFSTGEQAVGTPYKFGAIETCCTVEMMAFAVRYYLITKDVKAVDFLERAFYNGMLGAIHNSGRWATYDTPMKGCKRASFDSINFQSTPGAPELNCCSVNAPKGVGLIADWAYVADDECVYINFLGDCTVKTKLQGKTFEYEITGGYPVNDTITINIRGDGNVKLRIPAFGSATVKINGCEEKTARGYLDFSVKNQAVVEIYIKDNLSVEYGHDECDGAVSVYHNCLLLAFDMKYNKYSYEKIPFIRLKDGKPICEKAAKNSFRIAYDITAANGSILTLVDFESAGQKGSYYNSWIPIEKTFKKTYKTGGKQK